MLHLCIILYEQLLVPYPVVTITVHQQTAGRGSQAGYQTLQYPAENSII